MSQNRAFEKSSAFAAQMNAVKANSTYASQLVFGCFAPVALMLLVFHRERADRHRSFVRAVRLYRPTHLERQ